MLMNSYHEFDFHSQTKGNQYQNAWACVEDLRPLLEEMRSLVFLHYFLSD